LSYTPCGRVDTLLFNTFKMITKDRPYYRLKYNYDLLELILGKSRQAIKKHLKRKGFNNTPESMAEYIKCELSHSLTACSERLNNN